MGNRNSRRKQYEKPYSYTGSSGSTNAGKKQPTTFDYQQQSKDNGASIIPQPAANNYNRTNSSKKFDLFLI